MKSIRRIVRYGLKLVAPDRYSGRHAHGPCPAAVHMPPLRRRIRHVWDCTETLAVEDIAQPPALVRPYLVAHERALVHAKISDADLLAGVAR